MAWTREQLEQAMASTDPAEDPDFYRQLQEKLSAIPAAPPSKIESFARGGVQGLTLGFGDELAGIASNIFSPGVPSKERYERSRDQVRESNRAAQFENPWSYGGGEFGSALVPGAGLFKAATQIPKVVKAASQVKPLAQLAAGGAVAGGVGGLGVSEEEEPGPMLQDAATGAVWGAVAAPLIAPAAGWAAGKAGDIGATIKRKFLDSSENMTDRRIRQDLMDDDYTNPQDVYDEAQKHGGMLATIPDAPTTMGDAVAASKYPGPGRKTAQDAVKRDQAGQDARLIDTIHETVQPKWTNFHQFKEDIKTNRKEQSAAAYDEAYSTHIEPTPAMAEIGKLPSVQTALANAQKTLQDVLPKDRLGGPEVGHSQMELFDQVKRELDDMISKARNAGEFNKSRTLGDVKRAWVDELDMQNPAYARARNIYAGATAMDEATDLGRRVLSDTKMQVDDLHEIISDFGEGEMDALRIGLVRNMIDIIKNTKETANSAGRLFGTTRHKEVIDAIYPDKKSMGILTEAVESENNRAMLRNKVLGGSPTAELQTTMGSFESDRAFTVQGAIWSFLRSIGREGFDPDRMTADDYAELSRKMFDNLSLEEITRIMKSKVSGEVSADIGGAIGVGTAGMLGQGASEMEF